MEKRTNSSFGLWFSTRTYFSHVKFIKGWQKITLTILFDIKKEKKKIKSPRELVLGSYQIIFGNRVAKFEKKKNHSQKYQKDERK